MPFLRAPSGSRIAMVDDCWILCRVGYRRSTGPDDAVACAFEDWCDAALTD